ncbi:MAG: 4-hydroxythreonine-4-phosphate dehydrogenase PdxA [Ignisphaera sp.]
MCRATIGITMGDPAGVGPEVALKALRRVDYGNARYIIIGDYKVLLRALDTIKCRDLRVVKINRLVEIAGQLREPYVIGVYDLDNVALDNLVYGRPSIMGGKASYEYIVEAVRMAVDGMLDALVTMPISKESLNMAGYRYSGHTELLAFLTNTDAENVRMMLIAKHLRIVHVTTHVALRKVPDLISKERILKTIELACRYLKDYFNVAKPRIAVAGLNPHAGEGGLFGDEEIKYIVPAIKEARNMDIDVSGPYPPDTVFYRAYHNREFDAVIAMYHDQGHIALKMVGLMEGVNVTLGLPIIRTSPDHGTVWDKAGKGTADDTASYEAIRLALELAKNRAKEYR